MCCQEEMVMRWTLVALLSALCLNAALAGEKKPEMKFDPELPPHQRLQGVGEVVDVHLHRRRTRTFAESTRTAPRGRHASRLVGRRSSRRTAQDDGLQE